MSESWSHINMRCLDNCPYCHIAELEKALAKEQQEHADDEAAYGQCIDEKVRLEAEYKKLWEVLRTYNPTDSELEHIGFVSVEKGE